MFCFKVRCSHAQNRGTNMNKRYFPAYAQVLFVLIYDLYSRSNPCRDCGLAHGVFMMYGLGVLMSLGLVVTFVSKKSRLTLFFFNVLLIPGALSIGAIVLTQLERSGEVRLNLRNSVDKAGTSVWIEVGDMRHRVHNGAFEVSFPFRKAILRAMKVCLKSELNERCTEYRDLQALFDAHGFIAPEVYLRFRESPSAEIEVYVGTRTMKAQSDELLLTPSPSG